MRVPARRTLVLATAGSVVLAGGVLLAVDRAGRGPDAGPAAAAPLRVSSTEEGLTDRRGDRWAPAEGFVGGTRADAPPDQSIAGAADARLYASQHWGMDAFRAPLADGPYDVTLHLAETYFDQPEQRVFDVYAEGAPAAEDVDIVAEVGPDTAYDVTFPVDVVDGALDLEFFAQIDHPTVGAVSAVPAARRPTASPPPLEDTTEWASGASGLGVASGSFAVWRGTPVEVAGTWAEDEYMNLELPQLQPGGQYGDWEGDLDIAVGALVEGETWADAAAGRSDERWRASLTELGRLRGDVPGTTYIRFAHEMNGNWYPWTAGPADVADFQAAWKRYRALQQELVPDAQLVFCVNRETAATGVDWRQLFPGPEVVDVLSVDYYNNFPYVDTAEQWTASLEQVDAQGAPKGLEAHRRFAEEAGLPLAVSEWSGKATEGDAPAFIEGMHAFFEEHAGDGAGELLYEVQFNEAMSDREFVLFPENDMPESSVTYRDLW